MGWREESVFLFFNTFGSVGSRAAKGRNRGEGEEKEERCYFVYTIYKKICVLN